MRSLTASTAAIAAPPTDKPEVASTSANPVGDPEGSARPSIVIASPYLREIKPHSAPQIKSRQSRTDPCWLRLRRRHGFCQHLTLVRFITTICREEQIHVRPLQAECPASPATRLSLQPDHRRSGRSPRLLFR